MLELERAWRTDNNLNTGFSALSTAPPTIAIGAREPLEGVGHKYDYFHGLDGLSNVHTTAPHFTPNRDLWTHLFSESTGASGPSSSLPPNFKPSIAPAHEEILRLLRESEIDTITIIAVGPLTNLALAAATDVHTFLRAKEVLVMGGVLDMEGNATPVGEFNLHMDAYAAARLFSLTSPSPLSTAPPSPVDGWVPPATLSRPLNLTLFPLDITTPHLLGAAAVETAIRPLAEKGSPLAQWMDAIMGGTFAHMKTLYSTEIIERDVHLVQLSLHDPLCVWYALTGHVEGWIVEKGVDVRVEPTGQWTRGMCVTDKRNKKMVEDPTAELSAHDKGAWLHVAYGNRLNVAKKSPDERALAPALLLRVFGC